MKTTKRMKTVATTTTTTTATTKNAMALNPTACEEEGEAATT